MHLFLCCTLLCSNITFIPFGNIAFLRKMKLLKCDRVKWSYALGVQFLQYYVQLNTDFVPGCIIADVQLDVKLYPSFCLSVSVYVNMVAKKFNWNKAIYLKKKINK